MKWLIHCTKICYCVCYCTPPNDVTKFGPSLRIKEWTCYGTSLYRVNSSQWNSNLIQLTRDKSKRLKIYTSKLHGAPPEPTVLTVLLCFTNIAIVMMSILSNGIIWIYSSHTCLVGSPVMTSQIGKFMWPAWGQMGPMLAPASAPDGSNVGPINLAIGGISIKLWLTKNGLGRIAFFCQKTRCL